MDAKMQEYNLGLPGLEIVMLLCRILLTIDLQSLEHSMPGRGQIVSAHLFFAGAFRRMSLHGPHCLRSLGQSDFVFLPDTSKHCGKSHCRGYDL